MGQVPPRGPTSRPTRMDDVWDDSSDHGDRDMAERNWNRLQSIHGVAGYKDGVIEGKEAHIQTGFDAGFQRASHIGEALGRLLGIMAAVLQAAGKNSEPVSQALFARQPTLAELESLRLLFGELQTIAPDTLFTPEYYKDEMAHLQAARSGAAEGAAAAAAAEGAGRRNLAQHAAVDAFTAKVSAALKPIVHEHIWTAIRLAA
ncbi:hypothetical protein BC831DRAFT_482590 [Entophlyctis helioformis]|nr:hypothetical protein BC831DRAFT_482590 [Entophlyctis helioformis]